MRRSSSPNMQEDFDLDHDVREKRILSVPPMMHPLKRGIEDILKGMTEEGMISRLTHLNLTAN